MNKSISRRQFLSAAALAGAGLALPRIAAAAPLRYLHCPILMYHYVGDLPPEAGALRRGLTVSPARFAEQLDTLIANGYTPITLGQMTAGLLDDAPLPEKPVVLTFDDGYTDAYTVAAPLLSERALTGTFFLVSGFMDQPGYLTWAQAAALRDAGMEIGNHSATHPDLSALPSAALSAEIEGAFATFESVLGVRPTSFAYPLGRYNYYVRRAVEQAGQRVAVTTRDGTMQYGYYPYYLTRVRVVEAHTGPSLLWLADREAW